MIDTAPAAPSDPEVSSIEATLDVIGDRWSVLVLRAVFRGVRRFEQLHRDLGIARNVLTDRLGRLVDAGVITRTPYQQRPVRHEYRLTEKGRDLSSALIALMRWGDRWYHRGGPPTVLVHRTCGHEVVQKVTCPVCEVPVAPTAICSRPGPDGATATRTES